MRAAHFALWIVLVAACHGPALPAIPGKGGPPWVELQSEHFTLWTDASASRGRRLIREMEHLRQVVLGVGFGSGLSDARSLVIALRGGEEVGEFIPRQFIAYAWGGGGFIRQPVILIPADTNETDRHVITHVIAFSVIRNQPKWFAEGLANFFASVRADPDKATGDLGIPLDYIIARLRKHAPTPASTMFACNANACMDDMFYATAWAFFAYLANTHPTELLRYADRLNQLSPENAQQAWTEVFPDLAPRKLDSEVRKWLAYGRHTVWHFNVKLQEWPVIERKLDDGDVLAARALLRYVFAPGQAQVPAELKESLATDPTNALANILLASIEKKFAVDDARRVAAAHPDDWRGWWLVWYALNGAGAESVAAREKTCQLMVTAHVDPPRPFCTLK